MNPRYRWTKTQFSYFFILFFYNSVCYIARNIYTYFSFIKAIETYRYKIVISVKKRSFKTMFRTSTKLNGELASAKEEVSTLKKEKTDLEKSVNDYRARILELEAAAKKQKEESDAAYKKLQEEKEAAEAALKQAQAEIERLKAQQNNVCAFAICLEITSISGPFGEIYWIRAAYGFTNQINRKQPEILKMQCASAVLFASFG